MSIRHPTGRRSWAAAALALLVVPWGCQPTHRNSLAPRVPVVRVLLLTGLATANVSAARPPTARLAGDGIDRPVELVAGAATPVVRTARGWQVGGTAVAAGELTLRPAADDAPLSVAGRAYRGSLRFVPRGPESFDVVNDVDVEGYLKGVVAKEMLPAFAADAYRAQAVVARTYALYRAKTTPTSARYDVTDDTRDQVYGGIAGETSRARDAVDATSGQVVAYGPPGEERIFKAYFSSCCGGVGQSAADAFGDAPSIPLSAQARGRRCAISPWFGWASIVMPRPEFTRRVRRYGQLQHRPEQAMDLVARVSVAGTNEFGRPERFTVVDVRGRTFPFAAEELRRALNTDPPAGAARVPSSNFAAVVTATDVQLVNGHGFGHGVGLCQWCAQAQALAGAGFRQIVTDAYPHAVVLRAF